MAFVQSLLGALVAGTHAGRIYTDWPFMGGRLIPEDYHLPGEGFWQTVAHNLPAVQLNHRLGAYLLLVVAIGLALGARTSNWLPRPAKGLFILTAGLVALQAVLGIVTLRAAAPIGLSVIHQIGAVMVLTAAVSTAWRVHRLWRMMRYFNTVLIKLLFLQRFAVNWRDLGRLTWPAAADIPHASRDRASRRVAFQFLRMMFRCRRPRFR